VSLNLAAQSTKAHSEKKSEKRKGSTAMCFLSPEIPLRNTEVSTHASTATRKSIPALALLSREGPLRRRRPDSRDCWFYRKIILGDGEMTTAATGKNTKNIAGAGNAKRLK
jgi:hypothetical protein